LSLRSPAKDGRSSNLLDEYLDAAMAKPFAWGRADCCTFAADWVAAATGLDPGRCVRGLYSSADEANALIAERGGLTQLVAEEMDRLGFARTRVPISGDVGLVIVPAVGATGAIRSGDRWLFRRARGLVGVPADALFAWRVLRDA
jgi:hypothetical protein